jgi:hypothetical protein
LFLDVQFPDFGHKNGKCPEFPPYLAKSARQG